MITCMYFATFKKEQGKFNFDLDLRERDFNRQRARMSPASTGLMSPAHPKWTLQPAEFLQIFRNKHGIRRYKTQY